VTDSNQKERKNKQMKKEREQENKKKDGPKRWISNNYSRSQEIGRLLIS
jgi:hypothetical protein